MNNNSSSTVKPVSQASAGDESSFKRAMVEDAIAAAATGTASDGQLVIVQEELHRLDRMGDILMDELLEMHALSDPDSYNPEEAKKAKELKKLLAQQQELEELLKIKV